MKQSILLVEDDPSLGQTLTDRLVREGFSVYWEKSCGGAISLFEYSKIDLIILDVGLPDGDGFEVARRIRSSSTVPILFLTAMSSAEFRLEAYELGADDYIPKPFHLKELLLRLKRLLPTTAEQQVQRKGDIELVPGRFAVIGPTGETVLTINEFQIMYHLVERSPSALARDAIRETLPHNTNPRTIDNIIVRLRQLLKEVGSSSSIASIRGFGYKWSE